MTDPHHTSIGDDEFLTVQIGGGKAGQPERLLLIGRPHEGRVRVREWTTNTMNTKGDDYDLPPEELLEQIETAFAARRGVSEEMYRVRRWLEG